MSVPVCCSVLQRVAACRSVVEKDADHKNVSACVLQCVAVCCRVL